LSNTFLSEGVFYGGMEIEFREWPIDFGGSGYIALYHFDGRTAVLLAVRHQSEAGY